MLWEQLKWKTTLLGCQNSSQSETMVSSFPENLTGGAFSTKRNPRKKIVQIISFLQKLCKMKATNLIAEVNSFFKGSLR